MRNNKRLIMADIAEKLARKPIRGDNRIELKEVIKYFHIEDKHKFFPWCAAFIYHCSILAGFDLPVHYPERVKYRFASVHAWQEWAMLPENMFYYEGSDDHFTPERGDVIIYDNLEGNGPHDHIGIVLEEEGQYITTAEGNVNDISGIFRRKKNEHVNGYIRIRDDYKFNKEEG